VTDEQLVSRLRDAAYDVANKRPDIANLMLNAALRIEEYASSRD